MPKQNKYAWDEWFVQGQFTLKKGVDYQVSQSTMHQTIRNNASQRGLRVSIIDTGTELIVKVVGLTENGLPYPDTATIAGEHTGKLAQDGKHKEEAKESGVLLPSQRTVPTASASGSHHTNRTAQTR